MLSDCDFKQLDLSAVKKKVFHTECFGHYNNNNNIIIIDITGHHSHLLQAKDGKAKKSKQENIELFELPRTQSLLGSCHVALSSLLEGEHEIESECVCEGGEGNEKIDKKEEGPGIKSDASDKKKSNKGEC